MRGSKYEVGEVTIEDPLDPNLLTYSPSYQGWIDQYEIFRIFDKLLLKMTCMEGLLNWPKGAIHRDPGHYNGGWRW